MNRFYSKFFVSTLALFLISAVGFSQMAIMFIGRAEVLEGTVYQCDQDLFDSLVAWGYDPVYWPNSAIDAGSQSDFYGDYDGIFISETVNSGSMNSIMEDGYALPIVNLEGFTPRVDRWNWLEDNDTQFLQAADGEGTVDNNYIIIKDNSHYITHNFTVGDEIPWTTAEGADFNQENCRAVSVKEATVTYSHKLAVNKAHADQADFWHMVAVEDDVLPNKVFLWGVVATGLQGDEEGALHTGSPEFYTILKRACDWTWDNITEPSIISPKDTRMFQVAVFPNPARDRVIVRFESKTSGFATVTVYNVTGQRMDVINRNTIPGKNFIELSAADYAPGVYQIGIEMQGHMEFAKLVIR